MASDVSKVILSFDGTLADTVPRMATAGGQIISEIYDIPFQGARQSYMSFHGWAFPDGIEKLFPRDARNREAIHRFSVRQEEIYETADLHTGVEDDLKLLQHFEIPFAVCSSSSAGLVSELVARKNLPIDRLSGRELGSKRQQLKSLIRDGFDLYVGDATWDGILARDLNLCFIGVEHTYPRQIFKEAGLESEPYLRVALSEVLKRSPHWREVTMSATQGSEGSTSSGAAKS